MKNVISDKVLGLQPSGIRKFFDIVSEMDDVISLGVENRILIRRGISVMRVSTVWREEGLSTHPMQV